MLLCDGFTSLYSRPLLHNRRRSVGMLWRLSEKATDAVSPSGQPLLLVAINTINVDMRSEGKCLLNELLRKM